MKLEINDPAVHLESAAEISQDLSDQVFLFQLLHKKIHSLIAASSNDAPPLPSLSLLLTEVAAAQINTERIIQSLKLNVSELLLGIRKKTDNIDLLRFFSRRYAAYFCAFEWQSPVITSSDLAQQNGWDLGPIEDNFFFYKRERHYLAKGLETSLLKVFELKQTAHLSGWVFHSGMAAFSSLLQHLTVHELPKMLIGASCYCENRELLQRVLSPHHYKEFDETGLEALTSELSTGTYDCMLIDSLANCFTLAAPHLIDIMEILANNVDDSFTLIIDDTCGTKSKEIIEWLERAQPSFNVAILHSLAKYLQFGLDIVPGGFLITWSPNSGFLTFDRLRQLCGTIMSDSSTCCFPFQWAASNDEFETLRAVLSRRRSRMERNQRYLEEALSQSPGIIRAVSSSGFNRGTLLFVQFTDPYSTLESCKSLCRNIIRLAQEMNVAITHGTSFGFDVTRISSSRVMEQGTSPGIRVGVGTETRFEIANISNLLSTVR